MKLFAFRGESHEVKLGEKQAKATSCEYDSGVYLNAFYR